MIALQRAHRILGEAEVQIRRLIGKAAEDADYEVLGALAELARGLNELRMSDSPVPQGPQAKESLNAAGSQGRQDQPTKARPSRSYPRFFRSDNELVKVGWSKARQAEYQHRAPYPVLVGFLSALEVRNSRGRFTMAEILPLEIAATSVPDYQPYLCLAWLRSVGMVRKHGRDGYSLHSTFSSKRALDLWRDAAVEPEDGDKV